MKFIGFGAMDVPKPYKFIGFGAMEVTKPYKFIGFGAMDATKPHTCIGFWAMDATKPHIYHLPFYLFAVGTKNTKYPRTSLIIGLLS